MPIPALLAVAAAAWVGAGIGLGILLGRALVTADQQQACTCGACYCPDESDLAALVQPESWSAAEVDQRFAQIVTDTYIWEGWA